MARALRQRSAQVGAVRLAFSVSSEVVNAVGSASPYSEAMGASLARHDPDFLDSLLEKLNVSHGRLKGGTILSRIRCPVLLIRGDSAYGGVVDDTDLQLAMQYLSNCDVVNLVGVGHSLDDHVQLASAINRFLGRFLEA